MIESQPEKSVVVPPSFFQAFLFWLKLGLISFGGPAGQIAIMHHELIEKRRWISERRFLHALNFCMILPGPEAMQLATYIGWLMHGVRGGVIAGALFILPSLLLLICLSWIYLVFGDTQIVAGLLYGIKPAVIALVLFACYRIGDKTLKNGFLWGIAAVAFIALFAFNLPFPLILVAAALIGYWGGKHTPTLFHAGARHAKKSELSVPAYIDDETPTPLHARVKRSSLLVIGIGGITLWLAPMMVLYFGLGATHTLTQMAWFFTKAAFLTFGGAYAVLPYVYQGAVTHFAWLSPTQMMDGLALGETTPGPLIIVVAFVGFVGAAKLDLFGSHNILLAGSVGACVVAWNTFLPSFLFILLGGPWVEQTRNEIQLQGPLTSITAAVVGVIFNLSLYFTYHVIWPHGFAGHVDWFAASLAMMACVALIRFKVNPMIVIIVSAKTGLFAYWLNLHRLG